MNDIDLSLLQKPPRELPKAAAFMPAGPPAPNMREWSEIPWKERNILNKICYVIFCMISSVVAFFLGWVVLFIAWSLVLHAVGGINKATGGSLNFITQSQVPWWVWPLGLVVLCNRWLRTLALILIGGLVGQGIAGYYSPHAFWFGAGICAFVTVVCTFAPHRQVKVIKVPAKE
jgi:hypothetical protein